MNSSLSRKLFEKIEQNSLLVQVESKGEMHTRSLTSIQSFANAISNDSTYQDSKAKEKILSLTIQISDKVNERIDLYEGDKLDDIVYQIIQKYELGNELLDPLKKVIVEKITQLINEKEMENMQHSLEDKTSIFNPFAIAEDIAEEGSENVDDEADEIILTEIIKGGRSKVSKPIQGSDCTRKRAQGGIFLEDSKEKRKKNIKVRNIKESNTRNSSNIKNKKLNSDYHIHNQTGIRNKNQKDSNAILNPEGYSKDLKELKRMIYSSKSKGENEACWGNKVKGGSERTEEIRKIKIQSFIYQEI